MFHRSVSLLILCPIVLALQVQDIHRIPENLPYEPGACISRVAYGTCRYRLVLASNITDVDYVSPPVSLEVVRISRPRKTVVIDLTNTLPLYIKLAINRPVDTLIVMGNHRFSTERRIHVKHLVVDGCTFKPMCRLYTDICKYVDAEHVYFVNTIVGSEPKLSESTSIHITKVTSLYIHSIGGAVQSWEYFMPWFTNLQSLHIDGVNMIDRHVSNVTTIYGDIFAGKGLKPLILTDMPSRPLIVLRVHCLLRRRRDPFLIIYSHDLTGMARSAILPVNCTDVRFLAEVAKVTQNNVTHLDDSLCANKC